MMRWLDRLVGRFREPGPLRGARPVRREKTYSAESGYVYQYFYEGYRESRRGQQQGHDHVFSVTADRANRFDVTVFLGRSVLAEWERAHERPLSATEQYAIVKMTLFRAFDQQSELSSGADVVVSPADVKEHASTLDL
jgi:hypothetical protein